MKHKKDARQCILFIIYAVRLLRNAVFAVETDHVNNRISYRYESNKKRVFITKIRYEHSKWSE